MLSRPMSLKCTMLIRCYVIRLLTLVVLELLYILLPANPLTAGPDYIIFLFLLPH